MKVVDMWYDSYDVHESKECNRYIGQDLVGCFPIEYQLVQVVMYCYTSAISRRDIYSFKKQT